MLGEGSQIPWTTETDSLLRGLLAVTRAADNEIDVLVSTSPHNDFLQVMAWDRQNGVFHYYEREDGIWIWAGNSFHALDDPSRGQGAVRQPRQRIARHEGAQGAVDALALRCGDGAARGCSRPATPPATIRCS